MSMPDARSNVSKPAGGEWQPLEALKGLLPAEAFGPAELAEIVPLCRIERFAAGDELIREGNPSDSHVYFLLEGSVAVTLQGKFILRLARRGDIVGEMALISAAPRAATVKAEQASVFLVLDAAAALHADDQHGFKFRYYFSHLFNLILSEKLRTTSDRARLYEDAILHSRNVEEHSASLQEQVDRNLEEMRLYTHLVDSSRDAVVIADLDGRVQRANPAVERSFGLDPAAFKGRLLTELFGWGAQADQVWEQLRPQLDPTGWQGEVLVTRTTGETIPAHCSISVVQDDRARRLAYSVLLRDIRPEKAYQNRILLQSRQLQKAYSDLQELDRVKSHFLTLVSHELRTPITTILAYAETVVSEMAEPDQFPEFFKVIHQEARHLSEMVDKVLAITKLESGQMLLTFQGANLAELVRGQVAMHRSRATERGLELTFTGPDPGIPTTFDPERIGEAVNQILDNAIKYTDKGGIYVTLEQNERQSLLHIRDTGKGIPDAVTRTIFRKFERDQDPEHHGGGLGLGLPLCYLIVQAHAGELRISSRPGEGTTVSLVLPNRPAGATPEA
jgi:PAS domain S-box-containing protein